MARLLLLLLLLLAAPTLAQGAGGRPAVASGIEVVPAGRQVMVTVALSRPLRAPPRAFALAQPLRWVVDLAGASSARFEGAGVGGVAGARVSQFDPGTARVVVDLKAPMAVVAVTQDADNRLVLLLAPVAESAYRAQVARGRNPIGGFNFAPPPSMGEAVAEAAKPPRASAAKPTPQLPPPLDRLAGIEAVLAADAQRKVAAAEKVAEAARPAAAPTPKPTPTQQARADVPRVAKPPLAGLDAVAAAAGTASLPTVPSPNAAPPPASAAPELLPAAPPTRSVRPRVRSGRPLVVIDAGHGGKDPGAPSVLGGYEATVTLAIARAAKRAIEADGRLRVRLTRDADTFLTLNQRVSLARHWGADLFVSVHADSAPNPAARGASVYTLSEVASDAQAARLAAKENNADAIAGVSLRGQERDVSGLLIDLAQRDSMNASADFAQLLQASLQPLGLGFRSTFHRFAGFRVLKNVGVPAVLLEAGYMSNEADSRLLFSREGQAMVGKGLADAAARFLLGDAPRVAER